MRAPGSGRTGTRPGPLSQEDLALLARTTIELQADAPKCTCPCGCKYVLNSSISFDLSTCFSCRARVHFGGTPLTDG